jgi:hypothetical protein
VPATILTQGTLTTSELAESDGDDLWLPVDELEATTGWELRPEGMCREEVCVPIYGNTAELLVERDGGSWLNFAGFARYLSQPYARDDAHSAWYFGEASGAPGQELRDLAAPDFELQNLDGETHRLSDHLGKKVLLALWASW